MRGSDDVLGPGATCRVAERIHLDAAQDVETTRILVAQPRYLREIGRPVHANLLVHVPREAQMTESQLKRAIDHLLGGVVAVAERGVRMVVCSQHVSSSCDTRAFCQLGLNPF